MWKPEGCKPVLSGGDRAVCVLLTGVRVWSGTNDKFKTVCGLGTFVRIRGVRFPHVFDRRASPSHRAASVSPIRTRQASPARPSLIRIRFLRFRAVCSPPTQTIPQSHPMRVAFSSLQALSHLSYFQSPRAPGSHSCYLITADCC